MSAASTRELVDSAFDEVPDRFGKLCDQFGFGRDVIVESYLASAIVAALNAQGNSDALLEYGCPVAGWEPQPGRVDIAMRDEDHDTLLLIETKWCNNNTVFEMLWDALKLACIATPEDGEVLRLLAYAASRKRHWRKGVECSRYFVETALTGELRVSVKDFFVDESKSWQALLKDKSRPKLVPSALLFRSWRGPRELRILGDPFDLYVMSVEPAARGFSDVSTFAT